MSHSHDLINYERDVALLLQLEARRMSDGNASRGALEAVLAQGRASAGIGSTGRRTRKLHEALPLIVLAVAAATEDAREHWRLQPHGFDRCDASDSDQSPKASVVVVPTSRDGSTLSQPIWTPEGWGW